MPIMHIEYWDGCDQVSSALKFKRALTPLDFYKTVLSLKQLFTIPKAFKILVGQTMHSTAWTIFIT